MKPPVVAMLVATWALGCEEYSALPDAASCCDRCGEDFPLCVHCPGQFEQCIGWPSSRSCSQLEGLKRCECLTSAGQGTCDVVDGVVRVTYNATFCGYAADYQPSEVFNACTYEPRTPQ